MSTPPLDVRFSAFCKRLISWAMRGVSRALYGVPYPKTDVDRLAVLIVCCSISGTAWIILVVSVLRLTQR